MRASYPPNITGQERHEQFLKERINLVEKHFSNLCSAFGSYTRKTAALRDKSDEVAVAAHSFAEMEEVNTSLRSGLENFSSTICSIGDYRDAEVRRLESRVVAELSQYEGLCKGARDVLKTALTARDAEDVRRRYSTRLRESNPRLTQQIVHAESEVTKASAVVARTSRTLHEHIDKFESKKLLDIRAILLDFVTIELSFNTKAVEMYTKAYNDVSEINVEEDLKDFRRALNVAEPTSRLGSLKKTCLNNNSGFLSNFFSTTSLFKRPEFAPRVAQSFRTLQDKRGNCTMTDPESSAGHGGGDAEDDTSIKRCVQLPEIKEPLERHLDAIGKPCMEIATSRLGHAEDDTSSESVVHSQSVYQLFAKFQNSPTSSSINTAAGKSTPDEGKYESFGYCSRPAPKVRHSSERLRGNIHKSSCKFGSANSTAQSGDDESSSIMPEGGRFEWLREHGGNQHNRKISQIDHKSSQPHKVCLK